MKELINWSQVEVPTRTAACELCGWRNKNGNATPTGKRIAKTDWNRLSGAARNILITHGINE